jgi:Mn2+/Fe2+ NRAMP family transporter
MAAIQLVGARIGRVTGQGIVANPRGRYPPALLAFVLGLLIVANTINIAADLAAMGEALRLVVGGGRHGHALVFGALCLLLQAFVPCHRYVRPLRWLTLFLFA